jgi:hypothetical protein
LAAKELKIKILCFITNISAKENKKIKIVMLALIPKFKKFYPSCSIKI